MAPFSYGYHKATFFPGINHWFSGLGERLIGAKDRIPGLPPLYHAKALGLISRAAITVALKRDGPNAPDLPGGTVTYGDVDATNCGSLTYYGSIDGTSLVLEAVSLGATQAMPPAGVQWTTDFGLDTLTFVGPSSVVQPFVKSVGAVANSDGLYTIACNASVPPLTLTFSGTQYVIPSSELVRAFPRNNGTKCYMDMFDDIPHNTDFFAVGAAFARQYCLSFDYDGSRIGIGTNLLNRA
ncbi:aspartic protease 2B [Aphelenchoides avenae]|nr:aspartic protease 2B [Aphelenchus avenae]